MDIIISAQELRGLQWSLECLADYIRKAIRADARNGGSANTTVWSNTCTVLQVAAPDLHAGPSARRGFPAHGSRLTARSSASAPAGA